MPKMQCKVCRLIVSSCRTDDVASEIMTRAIVMMAAGFLLYRLPTDYLRHYLKNAKLLRFSTTY